MLLQVRSRVVHGPEEEPVDGIEIIGSLQPLCDSNIKAPRQFLAGEEHLEPLWSLHIVHPAERFVMYFHWHRLSRSARVAPDGDRVSRHPHAKAKKVLEAEDNVAEAVEGLLLSKLDRELSGLTDCGPSKRALGCLEVGAEVQGHLVLFLHNCGRGFWDLVLNFYPLSLRRFLFLIEAYVEARGVRPRLQVQILDNQPLKPDVLRSLEMLTYEDRASDEAGGGEAAPEPQASKGLCAVLQDEQFPLGREHQDYLRFERIDDTLHVL